MCVCVVVVYLSEFSSDCTIIIRNTIYQDHNDCRSSKVPYIERCNSLLLKFQLLKASSFGGFFRPLCLISFTLLVFKINLLEKISWAIIAVCLWDRQPPLKQGSYFWSKLNLHFLSQISKAHYIHAQCWLR